MSVPVGGGYYARTPEVDFGWLSSGWNLFKERSGSWAGATFLYGLIALALGVAALIPSGFLQMEMQLIQSMMHPANQANQPFPGMPNLNMPLLYLGSFVTNVLSAVLVGGLFKMAYRHAEGEQVGVLDVFSGFSSFVPLVALGAIYYVISLVGGYTCGIPSLVFAGFAMFAPIIIVTRNVGAPTAIAESYRILKSQWLMAALFVLVGTLMISFSVLLCGIGPLITTPIFVLAIAVGYKSFTGSQCAQYQGYGAAQPGVWPPPPGSTPPYGQQSPYGNPPGTPPPYGQPGQASQQGWQQPGQNQQPLYGTPPGPSFGQAPQQPQAPLQPQPPQSPQAPWQPPQQGPGQPPQSGGQWLGGNNPDDGTDRQ